MIVICIKCGEKCIAGSEEVPSEVVCSDCAYPELAEAAKSAKQHVESEYTKRTGKSKSCGEILRTVIFHETN